MPLGFKELSEALLDSLQSRSMQDLGRNSVYDGRNGLREADLQVPSSLRVIYRLP